MIDFDLIQTSAWNGISADTYQQLVDNGFNVRTKGKIEKDYHNREYYPHVTISLADLSELQKFIKLFGEIVMDGKTIEIYDDYRE